MTNLANRRFILAVALVISLFQSNAFAQGAEQGILFGHDFDIVAISPATEVTVVVNDDVSDGCWLNAPRVRSAVERELLDAGYVQIVEERVWGAEFYISALGYETSTNQCAVYLSLSLSIVDSDRRLGEGVDWIAISYQEVRSFGVLLTGPKSQMSGRILDNVEGFVDELLVELQQTKNLMRAAVTETENSESAKEFVYSIIE